MSKTKPAKCRYCEYKRDYEYLVRTPKDKSNGLTARIDSDQLAVSGWFDTFVGIQEERAKINFCPMCGRKLEEPEPCPM